MLTSRVPFLVLMALVFAQASLAQTTPAPPAPDAAVPTLTLNATAQADEEVTKRIGGGVSAPVVLFAPAPEFSNEARAGKIGGSVLVSMRVGADGLPNHVRVLRGVGYGLDEKAVEAVKQYRFKPAMESGKAVAVEMNVEVNFSFGKGGAVAPPVAATVAVTPPSNPYESTLGRPPSSEAEKAGLKTVADRKRFDADPRFAQAVLEAREARLTTDERLARWKRANNLADHQCVACLHTIVAMQISSSQWKDAAVSAKKLESVGPDAKDRFYGESQLGVALMHANDGNPKPDQAQQALTAFTNALATADGVSELKPFTTMVFYNQGRAYAFLQRNAEASAAFQHYLDGAKLTDPYRMRAEHFFKSPELATMPMAPPFVLTTSEGERMELDDMKGKVVLLDFWATWCGPCRQTLPEIQRVAKSFAGQPLIVISISSDSDEGAWKAFVAKNSMNWPQYRDANGALNRAFGVSSIPRFFTIDADGVLQSVKVGSGADISGDLKRLVKQAVKQSDHAPARAALSTQ